MQHPPLPVLQHKVTDQQQLAWGPAAQQVWGLMPPELNFRSFSRTLPGLTSDFFTAEQ